MASALATAEDPAQLAALSRKFAKPTWRDKLYEAWISGLLSGPVTHAVNVTSNALTQVWTLPEEAVAAALGVARLGSRDKVYLREVTARAYGMAEGAKDGLRWAAQVWRAERDPDVLEKLPIDLFGKVEVAHPGAIAGRKGDVIRTPLTLLSMEDAFYKAVAFRAELRSQALNDGLRRGLKGRALAEHVETILRDPPPDLTADAWDFARYTTFTRPLGERGQQFTRFVNSWHLRVLVPFIRTPTNIIKFATERSVLAPLMTETREAFRRGGAARDRALARMATGSAVSLAAWSWAADGSITGAAPDDPGEREAFYASGRQPYSVRVGDTWYAYGRLEPLGLLLGIAADMHALSGKVSEADAGELAGVVTGAVAQNLTEKTFLRSIADFAAMLHDPGRYAGQWLRNMASSVIPTGLAQVARAGDPYLREARTLLDAFKERLPVARESLPVRRDLYGEPVAPGADMSLAGRLASPVRASRADVSPLADELLRLEGPIGKPSRKIGGVELNPQQYDELQQITGRLLRQRLEPLVRAPNWQRLPDTAKEDLIRRLGDWAREAGRNVVLRRHRDLARKVLLARSGAPSAQQ